MLNYMIHLAYDFVPCLVLPSISFMYQGKAIGAIGHSLGSSFLSIFTSIGNGIILVIKAMISEIVNKLLGPLENFFSHIKLPIGLLMEVHL